MLTELEISNYGIAHLRQQAKNIKSMWKLVRDEGAVQENSAGHKIFIAHSAFPSFGKRIHYCYKEV